jgi:hypothetical protein
VLLVALQVYFFFAPPPPSDKAIAWTALISYAVLALVIWWLQDRKRASDAT